MRLPRPFIAASLVSLLFTSCATFTDAEVGAMQHRGVSPRLIARLQGGDPLTPENVIALTRRGVPPVLIVRQIEDAGVDYLLSRTDFERLRRAGVHSDVIAELAAASDAFAARFAPPRYEPYLVDPYYDDYYYGSPYRARVGGSIGLGFSTHRHFHHRRRH